MVSKCEGCPYRGGLGVAGPRGRQDAPIAIVGEAPGSEEVKDGIPFTGPSGQLLQRVIDQLGTSLGINDFFVTNALSCRPPYGESPADNTEAIDACHERLVSELNAYPRKAILALGNTATRSLTGDYSLKITQVRGTVFQTDCGPVVAGVHPAMILRSKSTADFNHLVDDLQTTQDVANGIDKGPGETEYIVINTPELWQRAFESLQNVQVVAADIETTGFSIDPNHPTKGIIALGVAWAKNKVMVFPFVGLEPPQAQLIKVLLELPSLKWVWHNGKFDTKFLQALGFAARVDHDTMLMHYCVSPDTSILCADGVWREAGSLAVGDELVGYDEFPHEGPGRQDRKMRRATVTCAERRVWKRIRVVTDRGSIVCTPEHPLLRSSSAWNYATNIPHNNTHKSRVWTPAANLRAGDKVQFIAKPWEPDTTYEGGWLAGIIDGEGCLTNSDYPVVSIGQKHGFVYDEIVRLLRDRGYRYNEATSSYEGQPTFVSVNYWIDVMRLLGTYSPKRVKLRPDVWEGRKSPKGAGWATVQSVETLGDGDIITLSTTTRTYIANGFVSHNSLNEQRGTHGLKQLASDFLGAETYRDELKPYLRSKSDSFDLIPRKILFEYLAKDCDYTLQLFERFYRELRRDGATWRLYSKLLIKASAFLQKVEQRGLYINQEAVLELRKQLLVEQEEALTELYEIVKEAVPAPVFSTALGKNFDPDKFNPSSSKQVAFLLYTVFRMRPLPQHLRTFTFDTREATLITLPPHPFVDVLLKYREVTKALATYVDGILKRLHDDSRVRTTYLIPGTETGRLSSQNPNVQNFPRSPKYRRIVQAPPGFVLVEADYSQAELRVLAALSKDPELTRVYVEGRDLHNEVSLALFGPSFTQEQRVRAKFLNFGIAYGRGPQSVVKEFGCSQAEAQSWITGWFKKYPHAGRYLNWCRMHPVKNKPLRSPFGRTRHWGFVGKHNLHNLQNEASNFPIQSTASDLTLLSAIRMDPQLTEWGCQIVNLVHDAISVYVPQGLENVAIPYMLDVMTSVPRKLLGPEVPFVADAKVGTAWGELEKWRETKTVAA